MSNPCPHNLHSVGSCSDCSVNGTAPSPQSVVVPVSAWVAGGEVSRAVACVDQTLERRIALEILHCDDLWAASGQAAIEAAVVPLARTLAALSPEAPARDGETETALRKAMEALDRHLPDTLPANDRGQVHYARALAEAAADAIRAHLSALTPRHEAPAEGAGERDADILERWANGKLLMRPERVAEIVKRVLPDLRARSSAPEAREGEPVEWRWRIEGVDGWRRCGAAKPHFAASQPGNVVDLQALYNHPAAPSADKLREAARKVLDGLNARIEAAPMSAVPVFDGIADLHAALKAEDC